MSKVQFFNDTESCLKSLHSFINEKSVVFIDSKVKSKHPEFSSFPLTFSIPINNNVKTLKFIESLANKLLKKNIDRSYQFIVIGGGTLADAIGFLASIYQRGVPWVNIPTTYLSQIDSAYGGKTGVNLDEYKNLLGSIYKPHQILVNLDFLKTLPKRELMSGKGEEFKYSLISKHEYSKDISLRSIKKLYRIKRSFYEPDLFDRKDKRIFLNFGHTLAHALEKVEGEKKWKHGEAVMRGCLFNIFLSSKIFEELVNSEVKAPKFEEKSINKIVNAMTKDKKNSGAIKFILLNKKQLIIKEFEKKEIIKYLKDYVSQQ